jgi:hypothetical protein
MTADKHDSDGNGWTKYEVSVLQSLAEIKAEIKEIRTEQNLSKIELALIKQKSGLWGAMSGCVTASITMAIAYFRSKA